MPPKLDTHPHIQRCIPTEDPMPLRGPSCKGFLSFNEILLHAPNGRLMTTLTKARLKRLTNLYIPKDNITPLPEAIANLTYRHKTIDPTHTQTKESKLYKPYTLYPEETNNGIWPIPDTLYDALHTCFNIQRIIHCNPVILHLRAK